VGVVPKQPWPWPGSRIIDVIDGDTVDALVERDLGFGGRVLFPVRLRLARLNTAKASTARGKRARDRVRQLTEGVVCDITTVKPYKYGGPQDRAGEYMAEVVLPDGSNLSDLLIREGLAVFWDGQGPRPADT
jgi:endonuclease YncB( thermonuclease family)